MQSNTTEQFCWLFSTIVIGQYLSRHLQIWLLPMMIRMLFKCVGDIQDFPFLKRCCKDLETDWKTVFCQPTRDGDSGKPARLEGVVRTSERYICSGSAVRSPTLKAGVGDVGVTMA